jgi:lysyl endopeptidase
MNMNQKSAFASGPLGSIPVVILVLFLLANAGPAQEAVLTTHAYSEGGLSKPPAKLAAPRLKAHRLPLPDAESSPNKNRTQKPDPHCEECEKIGYVREEPDFLQALQWEVLDDGSHVAKIELESKNAGGLRIKFKGELPKQVALRAYDQSGMVVSPFNPSELYNDETTPPSSKAEKTWWAPTVWGEVAGLEWHVPAGLSIPRRLPKIVAIAYMYKDLAADGTSGLEMTCHLDVTCFAQWASEATAVARMSFIKGSGSFVCSGTLLNRAPSDFAPIFITAAHCISRQDVANTLELYWLYQRSTCNGALPSLNSVPRTSGALVLKVHINADECLLGLYQPPPVNYYPGWDVGNTASWTTGDSATAISHPRGSHKRIAFGVKGGDGSRPFDLDTGVIPVIHVWDVNFSENLGVVETGSSGCPIFDSQHRVRGTLTGTYSFPGCPPITYHWGRLEYAWSNMKYFLNNMASPTYVNRSVSGDNNNDGDNERGTASNPFNTLREATYCVRGGDNVLLAPGNYDERFRIWRPMTLKANGGPVTLGSP